MPQQVTALLVVHDEPVQASLALEAIERQTRRPDRIIVVDSSTNPVALNRETKTVPPKTRLGEIIRVALSGLESHKDHWLWLVHDDSEPAPSALEKLLEATEFADSVAQVGPMQLSSTNQREITQLGVTVSGFGEIINPVTGQVDQSQHSQVKDVLAVGTSAMLIRTDAYQEVGGLDDDAPPLAADLDLSIRLRRHGYRVLAEPKAKVAHAAMTMRGRRGRAWLSGSTKSALRRATIHLRLVHDPVALALLYWAALPLITVYRLFWRLAQKQPTHLAPELRAGAWGFFTIFKRLAARANVGKLPMRNLKPLRATRSQVANHKRHAFEAEEAAQTLAAFERGDHEVDSAERPKSFSQSVGWVFVLGLLVLSWRQLPVSIAVSGVGVPPLSDDWFSIFARSGASWQPIGPGFIGPSNPFGWVLLTLSSVTFWAPNLSLVFLLWFARALAFASAWRFLSLLTAKAWQRNLGAVSYALLPAFTSSISAGEYPAIVSTILFPWLVFAVSRAAGLGRSGSARSDARTWSWVGLAGVLLAAVGASTPSLIVVALLGLALVALTRFRRFGYLLWIPLPLASIYLPLVIYDTVVIGQPLALLADPTTGVVGSGSWFGPVISLADPVIWSGLTLIVVASFAILAKRWALSLGLAVFGLFTYILLVFTQSLRFPADAAGVVAGFERVSNTGHAIAGVLGLVLIALAVQFASSSETRIAGIAVGVVLTLITGPLAWFTITSQSKLSASDGSVAPILLEKQAKQGTDLKLLVIDQKPDEYLVRWLPISGTHLEDSNLAYQFAAHSKVNGKEYKDLSQVVGDLVSGNGAASKELLKRNLIGYILVPNGNQNSAVVAALEASALLEGAGLTPFGELWRVNGTSAADAPETDRSPWSITKTLQLATLVGFGLLAIPTRPRTKRATDSAIFIDQSESELNV